MGLSDASRKIDFISLIIYNIFLLIRFLNAPLVVSVMGVGVFLLKPIFVYFL